MERKRGDGVLWEVAELFDLPGEMVGTLPHLELLGDKQLYLERHRGILSYSEEVLDINTPAGVLRLRGTGLRILSMTAEALRIGGGIDAVEWAVEAARRGAGEILLTSMDRDGSKDGFDCALTRAVARAVDIPVIASGGVGKLEHFAEGIIDGEADAVLAASVFHFGEFTVTQVKEYMRSQGIPVRL